MPQVVIGRKAEHAHHAVLALMFVQHHHLLAALGQRSRQIDQRSGFADAALAAGQRHNAHEIAGQQAAQAFGLILHHLSHSASPPRQRHIGGTGHHQRILALLPA